MRAIKAIIWLIGPLVVWTVLMHLQAEGLRTEIEVSRAAATRDSDLQAIAMTGFLGLAMYTYLWWGGIVAISATWVVGVLLVWLIRRRRRQSAGDRLAPISAALAGSSPPTGPVSDVGESEVQDDGSGSTSG